jgi:hypothetical protein
MNEDPEEEKENKPQSIKTQPLVIAKAKKATTAAALNQNVHERRKSVYKGPSASRPASGISFEGFTSFEEVRRGFEFTGDRPGFYPPPVPSIPSNVDSLSFGSSNASYIPTNASASYNPRRTTAPHKRHESAFSIASVSSYGHVINPGSTDPFDYGALLMPSLRERPVSEDDEGDGDGMSLRSVSMSMSVDDTFAFVVEQRRLHGGGGGGAGRGWRVRQRVESDASSFYFRGGGAGAPGGHRRRESNMSVSSQAGMPPVSLYNRSGYSHGHARNDSSASSSSVAISYARHGANSGFGAWAAARSHQHRREASVDADADNMSVMSDGGRDFEAMRRERVGMGRPGIGEKMFGSPGEDEDGEDGEDGGRGLAPPFGLTRIDASPLGMEFEHDEGTYDYYDSILDGSDEPRRASSSMGSAGSRAGENEYEDSIFEKTGYRSSMEVDGDDESSVFGRKQGGRQQQQGRGLFPPASRLSMMSNQSLSVGGLSDGNAREDDTMISVCFLVLFFLCWLMRSLLFVRCSEVDTLAVVPSGQLSKLRHAYA